MVNLNSLVYHKTNTWPSHSDLVLESNMVLGDFLRKIFVEGVFIEINKLLTSKEYPNCTGIGHITLIAICSAIDSLSSYVSGGGRVGMRFITFISQYFPTRYAGKEQKIYESFRCDSIHGWNLHKSIISGIPNDKDHLLEENDIIYISLYDFFNDLTKAFESYHTSLKQDDSLKINLLKRYKELRKLKQ